jgi:DNA methylase
MATPLKVIGKRQTPQIDREFHSLIAPLKPEERRQLESNLLAEGCRDPLVTWRGTLLDGHNRLEICTRLHIVYKTINIELPDREAALLWIESNQLGRRNLTPDQRAAIAFRILQRRVAISKRERARKGGLAGGSGRTRLSLVVTSSTGLKRPRQRELAAKQLGVPSRQIRSMAGIAKHSTALVDQIVAGTLTIKKAKDQIVEESRQAKRLAALQTNSEGCRIYTGDLSLLHRLIPDNSADLFLCDPPYQEDAIPLYGRLAELAVRKLKPGRLCAVMCGQMYLDRVMTEMAKHLDYSWLCAVTVDAPTCSILPRKISNKFKPVLLFVKRPAPAVPAHPFLTDMILGKRDKEHHWMGQGVEQFRYFVERLTDPGDLVVDPFCGGGTVPVACVATGRRYIATEKDLGTAAAARARIVGYRKSRISR